MTRERMSRPSSSVPNQCPALGGCNLEGRSMALGLCGAIHGPKSAKTTKITANTAPAVASALRRPNAAAAFQVVETETDIRSDDKSREIQPGAIAASPLHSAEIEFAEVHG